LALEQRGMGPDVLALVGPVLSAVAVPPPPTYPPDTVHADLMEIVRGMSAELKAFFVAQFESIELAYTESIKRAFEILNRAHLEMVRHLERARAEVRHFLVRPGVSQRGVTEFQRWHCDQVERCMRRMPKVKDECSLRLVGVRDGLMQIENERKAEEEAKTKDLLNAPFRTTLFELVSNACTLLAQAEIDRWASTRCVLVDANQVISDTELVPPLPRKKLNMVVDPSRLAKKGAKRPTRETPTNKIRGGCRLGALETPLFEQLEMIKRFVSDAAVVHASTPALVSMRGKPRVPKDRSPFAAHKITTLSEFRVAFEDDDVYIVARMDEIAEMVRDEIQVVQQAFDAFTDDSAEWIQAHYLAMQAIADTAVAYMARKVSEEAQMNQFVLLDESRCVVNLPKLLVATEKSPKISPSFAEALVKGAVAADPEAVMRGVFESELERNRD